MRLNKFKAKLINKAFYMLNHSFSFAMTKFPFFPQTPFVLHIRITSKCNLSCPFCYLKEGLNQEEENLLSLEEWEKILSPLPRTTIIDITGAEPFMAKDFDKFLTLLKKLGFKCSVTTNGTLYNDHIIQTIMDSSIEYILVSLDALKDTHNELRGSPKAFDRSINFIQTLKSRSKELNKKLLINVKTMIIDENLDEVIPLLNFTDKELSPDIMTVNLPFQNEARGGRLFKNEFNDPKFQTGNTYKFKNISKALSTFEQIAQLQRNIETPIIFKPSLGHEMLKEYIKAPDKLTANGCQLYKNNLTIYYDGNVTPCDISYKVSNIRELNYDIRKTYQFKKYLDFTKMMKKHNKACEGCVFSKQILKDKSI